MFRFSEGNHLLDRVGVSALTQASSIRLSSHSQLPSALSGTELLADGAQVRSRWHVQRNHAVLLCAFGVGAQRDETVDHCLELAGERPSAEADDPDRHVVGSDVDSLEHRVTVRIGAAAWTTSPTGQGAPGRAREHPDEPGNVVDPVEAVAEV